MSTPNAVREGEPPPGQPGDAPPTRDLRAFWTPLALAAAVIGVIGSLYLSLGMELKACPLCFYQRAFIMASAAILGFGLFMRDVPRAALAPLALGPAVAGACVAVWHVYKVHDGTLECPTGASHFLLVPVESLIIYVILVALLVVDVVHQARYITFGIGALLLGYVLASTSIKATPPAPTAPAPAPLDGCRKYVAPE
jgi:Disulfide bond formation protein DsbB